MKALSLWQPWASLLGRFKANETRHWGTNYRGPVAIHAAKRVDDDDAETCTLDPWFRAAMAAFGWSDPDYGYRQMARGCIVAVGTLVKVALNDGRGESEQELAFGNYGPSRLAWTFQDVGRLVSPIALRGRQGLWELDPETAMAVRKAVTVRLTLERLEPQYLRKEAS